MNTSEFAGYLERLTELTLRQRAALRKALDSTEHVDKVLAVIEHREEPQELPALCPHCGHGAVRPWGSSCGLHRYRCRGCLRTFNALTNTPLSRLRYRERWMTYSEAMIAGLSVRKAATLCGVHSSTAFRWRHRFLKLPRDRKDTDFNGIVEADETYFLESFKGQRSLPRKARQRGGKAARRGLSGEQIPVLIVRDRSGATSDSILPGIDKQAITAVLKPLMHSDTLLCSDGAKVYQSFAQEQAIAHEFVNLSAGIRVREHAFHIQNVNAYDSRLKGWMQRFHGVATKYLPNYLGWRRMLDKAKGAIAPAQCLALALGGAT